MQLDRTSSQDSKSDGNNRLIARDKEERNLTKNVNPNPNPNPNASTKNVNPNPNPNPNPNASTKI